jgi:hypothetical protein
MPRHPLIRTRALLGTAFLACLASNDLLAQMVEAGVARDAKLGTPLECLHVALLDSTDRAIAHTVTDSAGQFLLEAPRPGAYRVQFLIYRWEPLVGPVDTLAEGSFKQRIYPLSFTSMLVHDSARGRPSNDADTRENREKYRHLESFLRRFESDSTWRSRQAIVSDLGIRYPAQQVMRGGAGTVLARFIVDSTGRARPESWQSIIATHPDFEKAVKGTMPKARWKPANLAGRPVCELTMDFTRFYRDHEVLRIVLETR